MVATTLPGERLTRAEYDRLGAEGRFDGQRVELIRGRVVAMSPVGTRHREAIHRLMMALLQGLGDRARVEVQQPLVAADESEPEPDISVIANGDYASAHAAHAFLVVEVADSSRGNDLGDKARLYAASAVAEYWVLDLISDVMHVHRRGPGGDWIVATQREGPLALVAFPDVGVDVGSLIPRRA